VNEPQRHGLACDIPLPANTTFDHELKSPGDFMPGVTSVILQYHVANGTLESVREFYTQRLPSSGWKCVDASNVGGIEARQDKRILAVLLPQTGDATGIAMRVEVSTFSKDVSDSCNG
jgi:hypothetical protein